MKKRHYQVRTPRSASASNLRVAERVKHGAWRTVICIQAFTFNAFACLDNLAWIWVCEKKLTTEQGDPIPAGKVGLGKKCKLVRRSLPADIRKYLKSLDAWFDHLENFRHALAHRIPLYIPPVHGRGEGSCGLSVAGRAKGQGPPSRQR